MNDVILISIPRAEFEEMMYVQARKAVSEMNPAQVAPVEEEDLMTIKQAAELLQVSVPTVYGYINQRSIPHMKRRGRLYFSKQELTAWIETGRRATIEEIKSNAINSLAR